MKPTGKETIPTPSEGWYLAMTGKKISVVFAESHDDAGAVIWPQDGGDPYEWPEHEFTLLAPLELPGTISEALTEPWPPLW